MRLRKRELNPEMIKMSLQRPLERRLASWVQKCSKWASRDLLRAIWFGKPCCQSVSESVSQWVSQTVCQSADRFYDAFHKNFQGRNEWTTKTGVLLGTLSVSSVQFNSVVRLHKLFCRKKHIQLLDDSFSVVLVRSSMRPCDYDISSVTVTKSTPIS